MEPIKTLQRWHYKEMANGTFRVQATRRHGQAGCYTDMEGDVYAASREDVLAVLQGTPPHRNVLTVDGDLLGKGTDATS